MKKLVIFILVICTLFVTACQKENAENSTAPTIDQNQTEQPPTETSAPTIPEETIEQVHQTEPPEIEWPEDAPYLQSYWDAICNYKMMLEHRLSKNWNWGDPLPDVSDTFKKALEKDEISDYLLQTMVDELSYADDDKLEDFGYILYDLDGNKIPELFWVRKDYSIVAAFTYYKDEMRILEMYWYRYRGNIAGNGQYFTWGSDGAADNSCNVYILNKGKLEEIFSFYSESNFRTNTVSYYEATPKEKLEIDEVRFESLSADFPENQDFIKENCTIYALDEIPTKDVGDKKKDAVPYKQKVKRADQSIYAGPGSAYSWLGTTEEPGTFTITTEVRDENGDLWGRIKSGSGWINLTEVRKETEETLVISANYADKALLNSNNYHHCIADDSEYMVQVAFYAYQKLTNVSLFEIVITEDTDVENVIFTLDELDSKKPLLADLVFPGDMSMYGIRFTDKNGKEYTYAVAISGMDGSLDFFLYE